MDVAYFERWARHQQRGIGPKSSAEAESLHRSGDSVVAVFASDDLLVTTRGSYLSLFVGLAEPRGAVAWGIDGGDERVLLEEVRVIHEPIDFIYRRDHASDALTGVAGTQAIGPRSLAPNPDLEALTRPAFGAWEPVLDLPRNPWAYVVLPDDWTPPDR